MTMTMTEVANTEARTREDTEKHEHVLCESDKVMLYTCSIVKNFSLWAQFDSNQNHIILLCCVIKHLPSIEFLK